MIHREAIFFTASLALIYLKLKNSQCSIHIKKFILTNAFIEA